MSIKFANSAFATLAAGINSSATSITLTTGQGARFPSLGAGDYFYATLIDASNNLEIVKCTARSTDVLTVTRAQESTTARAFSTGDRIELRITAAGMNEAVGILDGDRGDITVSGDGLIWTIDSLAVTDAKIADMAATKLTGTIDKARMFAGAVLQVVETDFKTATTYNSGSFTSTGVTASITPRSTSSKVLVMVKLDVGSSAGGGSEGGYFRLYRNGSDITLARGDNSSNRYGAFICHPAFGGDDNGILTHYGQYLDSPSSSSSTTYTIYVRGYDGSGTYPIYLNRSHADSDASYVARGVCRMTLMEIAA